MLIIAYHCVKNWGEAVGRTHFGKKKETEEQSQNLLTASYLFL